MKEVPSFFTFGIGALCFMAFLTAFKPVCTENLKSDHSGDEVRPGWRLNE